MFGFVKTPSNLCNLGLRANVSTIKSSSRVEIYIRQVMPKYDRCEWCSKSIAISFTFDKLETSLSSKISVLTKVYLIVSIDP